MLDIEKLKQELLQVYNFDYFKLQNDCLRCLEKYAKDVNFKVKKFGEKKFAIYSGGAIPILYIEYEVDCDEFKVVSVKQG